MGHLPGSALCTQHPTKKSVLSVENRLDHTQLCDGWCPGRRHLRPCVLTPGMKGSFPYKTMGLGLPLRMVGTLSNLLVEPSSYETPPTDAKSPEIKQVWKGVMTGVVRAACLGYRVGTASALP